MTCVSAFDMRRACVIAPAMPGSNHAAGGAHPDPMLRHARVTCSLSQNLQHFLLATLKSIGRKPEPSSATTTFRTCSLPINVIAEQPLCLASFGRSNYSR